MIETLKDIQAFLSIHFPGARCLIMSAHDGQTVLLKSRKGDFRFRLFDYRASWDALVAKILRGHLVIQLVHDKKDDVASDWVIVDENAAYAIAQFIVDHAGPKLVKVVQLNLFESLGGAI